MDRELEVRAARAPDEQRTEFLLSTEPSFSPVQVAGGPDGALCIVDAQDRNERGRILRVVPDKFKRPKPPQLGKAKTYDLAAMLAQANGWYRDTAARLLFERGDPAAVPLLANMARQSKVPLVRLHALHALSGLGALQEAQVLRGLGDDDEHMREHAVLLSERLVTNGVASDELWARLKSLAADPSPRVRYQLALTLGVIRRPDKAQALSEILRRDGANGWVQNAVLSSLAEGAADLFILLASDPGIRASAAGQDFLRRLGLMIGTKGQLDEVSRTLNFIDRTSFLRRQAFSFLYALGEGLHRTRSALFLVDRQGQLQRFYSAAASAVADEQTAEPTRLEAIRLLGVSPALYTEVGFLLLPLCDPHESRAVQTTAMGTFAGYDDPRVLEELLPRWPGLTPPLRRQAVAALLVRSDRLEAVLAAVEAGNLPASDLSPLQLDFLRTFRDRRISRRAVRLFGPVALERPKVVQQYNQALQLGGAPEHGGAIFLALCARCHQRGRTGTGFGPDLTTVGLKGKEKLLIKILQPGAVVSPQYATWIAETQAGENLVGLKESDNPTTVTLRQPDGAPAVWPRSNLQSLEKRPWSLMPAGLEEGLSLQDMADLLQYLITGPEAQAR
jgi:putative heme-binding domain-containing protein